MNKFPFAEAAFDLVVAALSVAHWCDQAAGLAEIRRVMAPGAILVQPTFPQANASNP